VLPIQNLKNDELHRLRIACAFLFSPDHARDDFFLKNLELPLVTRAFREKAKRYHPDLHRDEPKEVIEKRKERFVKIKAYDTLRNYFPQENSGERPHETPFRRKIIAVGGAKGGIGKSIFAANLGVLFSSAGHRTVLVDLDLGGANLHLYLGNTTLSSCINDFLCKRIPRLEDAMVSSKFGPRLIGGDSSQFGAANITFAAKMKLLRSIKQIDADVIILDLGGDTSYNIVDFFLAADIGIVMGTCDPAAYLEAYNFIKIALYRKLNRLYGEESEFRLEKDPELAGLIGLLSSHDTGERIANIHELRNRVRQQQPKNLFLINQLLRSFKPRLVLNMVEDRCCTDSVVWRIQEVAEKMLCTEVNFAGSLPLENDIKRSARDLIPAIAKSPNGSYATNLNRIAGNLGLGV
jgi:flagellar biosynthesis protein FlhG